MIFILLMLSSFQLFAQETIEQPSVTSADSVCASISNSEHREECEDEIRGKHINATAAGVCFTISDDYHKQKCMDVIAGHYIHDFTAETICGNIPDDYHKRRCLGDIIEYHIDDIAAGICASPLIASQAIESAEEVQVAAVYASWDCAEDIAGLNDEEAISEACNHVFNTEEEIEKCVQDNTESTEPEAAAVQPTQIEIKLCPVSPKKKYIESINDRR